MSLPSKAFCELFHFELRLFFLWRWDAGINVIPARSRCCFWTMGGFFVFFSPHKTRTLCFQLLPAFQNRMKNAHDRANQSTRWQQSQPALMNPRLETPSNASDVTMAFVLCWQGSFQLPADLRVSRGS